jgi:DNA-binding protein H-NS
MDLSSLKAPIGSLVVDGAMIFALVWSWSAMATRLEALDQRVAKTETMLEQRQPALDRLAKVEERVQGLAESREEFRTDIIKRLERIEAKLDKMK